MTSHVSSSPSSSLENLNLILVENKMTLNTLFWQLEAFWISPLDVEELSDDSLLESLLSEVSLLDSLDELWRFFPLRFLSFFDFLRESSLDFVAGSW